MSYENTGTAKIILTPITGNATTSIPAGYFIENILIENTTVNAIVGGLKIGTTNGGVDVVAALAVGANALTNIPDATLLKSVFSINIFSIK